MKVADLFAGVGGLSQGFIKAGFDVVLAVEYDYDIAMSYKKNHPHTDVYADDICNLDFRKLHEKYRQIDVVMGGPPCQGFSQKGKRLSINVIIITKSNNLLTKQDIERYNKQYNNLTVKYDNTFHDRYFILDDSIVYHCGTSINRIGYKTFSITRINDDEVKELLIKRINTNYK